MKTLLYASLLSVCLCAYSFNIHKGEIDNRINSSAQFLDADLTLTKSTIAALGTKYGTNVPFNLTITNNSLIEVREVMIEDLIPEGYEFNFGNNTGWSYDPGSRIASYTHMPVINPGEFAIVTLNLILGPSMDINGWLNRAEIIGAIGEDDLPITDSNPDDNKDSLAVEVLDLALKKELMTAPEYCWDQDMDFLVTIYNQGNTDARFVQIRDYKPEGYFFNMADNSGEGWVQDVDTFKNTINIIPAGGFVEIPLVLQLKQDMFDGLAWDNYAEVASMADYTGAQANDKDADSTPGSNSTYENMVRPGDPFDDEIFGNGEGVGEDEDDHDVAGPEIFDLAIRKERVSSPPSYSYTQEVENEITVFNQGNITGEDIVIVDYLPCGFELKPGENAGWIFNDVTRQATFNVPGQILPNSDFKVSIILDVNPCYVDQPNAWTNACEIFMANSGRNDIDSTPDNIDDNDNGGVAKGPSDNDIDGDAKQGEDEDDHDVELSEVYDLADKIIIVESPPYDYGQTLTLRTWIYNQGNVIAENIVVRNNLPAGFTYLPINNTNTFNTNPWDDTNPLMPTILINGPLVQGDSTFVDLKLRVNTAGTSAKDWYVYSTIQVSQDTVGVNRFDDADSLPSTDWAGETSIVPGSPEDDNIFFNSVLDFFEDQDDYDVAGFDVLDLALIKTPNLPGPFYVEDKVPFKIKIFNQGSLVADNIVIGDTIPEGFAYNDADNTGWAYNPGTRVATRTIAGPLALGAMDSVEIVLEVVSATGVDSDWTNISEIQAAREEGSQVGAIDFDSPMDTNFSNDVGGTPRTPEDDHIDDNGSDFNMDGITDEDNHDPALVDVIDITHQKTLTSSNINPDGTFTVIYEIVVNNNGNAEGPYTLQDQPGFDDDIEIVSASYTSNTPNNGVFVGPGLWTLASGQTIPAGGTHTYEITVIVDLDLSDGSGGDNTYTICGNGGQQPGQEGEGLFNKSLLDDDNDGDIDEESTDCGDLPYIIVRKDIASTSLQPDGTYDVTYNVEVSNIGGTDGKYSLTDTPQFDDDITINSGSFTGTQSGPMNTSGPTILATNSSIGTDEIHIYIITFNVSIDLEPGSNDGGDNEYTPCSNPGNDPGSNPGEGLYNKAELDRGNDGTVDVVDDACGDLPYLTMVKNFVSATQLPSGNYTVVYTIDVENAGGTPDVYTLDDTPQFDDDIVIISGSFSGQNNGAMNTTGSTNLATSEVINVGEVHSYTITLEVSIDLDPASQDGGDNVYTSCRVPGNDPGSNPGEGLYNLSELDSGSDGTVDIRDDACGDLPYVDMEKDFISATQLPDGSYDVIYTITVDNVGGVTGTYSLYDTPLFDNDIVINSGNFSGHLNGPMNLIGATQLAADESIDPNETQVYTITLNVTIDLETNDNDPGDNQYNPCSDPGNDPGSNPGEGLYNLAELDRGSNGRIDVIDDACGDLPYVVINKNFVGSTHLPDDSYNVEYQVIVRNIGGTDGNYSLSDTPGFDDDIVINSGSFSGQNNGAMNTTGTTVLASNEIISTGQDHFYNIILNVTIDLDPGSTDGGDNFYNECSSEINEPGSNPGEGLYNKAELDRGSDGNNDAEDDTCADLPYIIMEKDFVSADQLPDGTYNVTYDIDVTNIGGATGNYSLSDTPSFDDDIVINGGGFSILFTCCGPIIGNIAPDPGTINLAINTPLGPGLTDMFTITYNVTIDLEPGSTDGGDNIYTACSNPGNEPGSNPGEGLYNKADLDRGGDGTNDIEDDACGDLPYVIMDKEFISAVEQPDGSFNVTYEIEVENIGGATGDYTLTDTPQFDDDITINSGTYSGQNNGIMNNSGSTILVAGESIAAGATHFYTIELNVTLDLSDGGNDGGDNEYDPCSSPENEPGSNPGEGLYNLAELDRGSDGNNDIEDDTCGDLYVSIGDFVWNDLDGDGIQDNGEPGIEDVTVTLYTCDGGFVESIQTNGQGIYEFDNLLPGCYYFEVSQPEGFEISLADQGGDDSVDSDLTEDNGPLTSADFQIDKSESIYDFAFIGNCIGLGGEVWYDLNENDMRNSNEDGINGIPVVLWKRVDGQWEFQEVTYTGPVPNTPSDDGYYKFCVLPGEYHLEFLMPPNSLVTVRPNIGPDESIDSDVTDAYGLGSTDSYLVSRTVDTTFFCDIDAGYYPMGTAGDHVWIDVDGNGLRESLEPTAEGILVEAFNINDEKVAETTSDEYGRYRMEYLKKDPHYFKFTPPDGFGFTWSDPSNTLEDDIDSDVDHTNGPNTTQYYMMVPGSHTGHIDAGLSYAALPVEWLSFTGENVGNANLLEWSTTSETNTLKYEVMRKSPSDIGFFVIGEVEAAGFSANTKHYDFTDTDLAIEGAYYYKLRQVDQNGDYSFSDVIKIDVSLGSFASIAVYPNPAINYINVQGIHQLDKVEMYDMTGALIQKWDVEDLRSIRLDLYKTIPTGNYLFKLTRPSGESEDHQIMILNNR